MLEVAAGDPHAGHGAPAGEASDPHAGHAMPEASMPDVLTSADVPGRLPATPLPGAAMSDPPHAADRYFDPDVMHTLREQLRSEHGAMSVSANFFDELETTFNNGREGYAWDVQGWYGSDIHRAWWKSEGEGDFTEGLEQAELQLLYGRALTPYFDLQAGVRQNVAPGPDRFDLALGVQGLAPYWFELDAALYLSIHGELRMRAQAEYDLRLTQRLILQLSSEINLSAEHIPELTVASGVTEVEAGVRLRYEFSRQFAPYVGAEWTSATGATRGRLRRIGEDPDEMHIVVGLRAWF